MSREGEGVGYPTEVGVEKQVLKGLVLNTILRDLGRGAVMLFLPVHLYRVGGIDLLLKYVIVSRGTEILIGHHMARIIGKVGFKAAVIMSGILGGVVYTLFKYAADEWWWVAVAGSLAAVSIISYWIPHHLLFLETDKERFGERASWLSIIARWSQVLGPLAGGFLIVRLGFGGLFEWGVIMLLLSTLPIWLLEPDNLKWKFHVAHYWKKLEGKWFSRDLLAYMGYGMEETMLEVMWPVFLWEILKSPVVLGGYKSLVLVASSLMVLIVGKRQDKGSLGWLFVPVTAILSGIWIVRGLWSNPLGLVTLVVIDGWAAILMVLPFGVYALRRAKVADSPLYIVEREAGLNLGRVVAAGISAVIIGLGGGWSLMVLIGVAGLWLMNLLPKTEAG